MYRFLFLLFLSNIFLLAQPFKEYKTFLISLKQNTATIQDSPLITLGSSGVVIHKFDENQKSIIARASVIKKDGNFATIKFSVFDMLEQSALPLPGILPSTGDEVILNFLYNRALIVSPNKEIYDEITNHFKDIEWIHPDLMAAYLSKKYKPNPSKDEFRQLCKTNTAGVIFFALNQEGFFVDCMSFKVLKTIKTGKISYYKLPFYSRIDDIQSAFWKIGSSQIDNFDKYYRNLLVK